VTSEQISLRSFGLLASTHQRLSAALHEAGHPDSGLLAEIDRAAISVVELYLHAEGHMTSGDPADPERSDAIRQELLRLVVRLRHNAERLTAGADIVESARILGLAGRQLRRLGHQLVDLD
jgi:hypothetical protein